MNAPERARNLSSTTKTSGLHSRSIFDPSSYDRDDADLEALVQRASSRPPAPHADFEDVHVPRLSPLVVDELQGLMMPAPLSIAPAHKPEALSTQVKAMIALPWTLLVIGGVAAAISWPRAVDTAAPGVVDTAAPGIVRDDVAMIAPSVAEAAGPSLAVAAAVVPTPIQPVVAGALAPTPVAAGQPSVLAAPAREARTPTAEAPAAAAPAQAATEQPATPAVAVAEAQSAPVGATPQVTAPLPTTAPNGTNFDAIRARIENGGGAAAPVAAESTATLPERPSRGDVSRALRSVQSAVDACTSDVGTATVRLTVSNDGTVTAASATGDYAGTSTGSCMADAVRAAHFPPFAASSMTISYPFTLH